MVEEKKFFTDSAAYDRAMGRCSRVAGKSFLEWLALPDGLTWLDVGCGTGSFTELVLERTAPGAVSAVDPSAGQIEFARGKPWAGAVDFRQGDALSLPFDADAFDVAVMALVIQYIADPAAAMSEIVRVVRPGGTVATYTWPSSQEAHPMQPMYAGMAAIGLSRTPLPGNQIRTLEALAALFEAAGLVDIHCRSLEIELVYENFDDYWLSQTASGSSGDMTDAQARRLKTLMRERLPPDEHGRISYSARANAVKARKPG